MSGNASVSPNQFAEFLKVLVSVLWSVVKNMTPSSVQHFIENPKLLEEKIRDAFIGNMFQAFTTITIGLYSNLETLKNDLLDGFLVNDRAADIFTKIQLLAVQKQIELVEVYVAELGFNNGATLQEIYTRAQNLGLKLCPAEVGPVFRLAYQNQPLYEWLIIGMEPVRDSAGVPRVFRVGHSANGVWLDELCGNPNSIWGGSNHFVFCR